jgi:hypothetical protein
MPSRIRNVPSPVEVATLTPEQALAKAMKLPRPASMRHRVIPAVVGSVFASVMLVGLGCTPLFRAGQSNAPEQATIVHRSDSAGGKVAQRAATSSDPTQSPSPSSVASSKAASGKSAPSAAHPSPAEPAKAGVATRHSFSVKCDPAHEAGDASAHGPETVTLTGIMAGRTNRAALLNGAVYREGDRFGSGTCPWTVAAIEPTSVRLEKTFGDRTCAVTIHWQSDDAATH